MKIFIVFTIHILLASFYTTVNAQLPEKKEFNLGNCETNSARLDALRIEAMNVGMMGGIIIAVARLGDGEYNPQFNQRRLYTVKKYLGSSVTNLILTQGERVEGNGRVEIYLHGFLREVLLIKKCQDLPVGSCDNDVLDNKNYQLSKPKRKIKCGR